MNNQMILEELIALLESKSVKIRTEPLGGAGGGLCSVKGDKIFFVDTDAPCAEVTALCAEAIVKLIDIDNIYIRPEVRQFIENNSQG